MFLLQGLQLPVPEFIAVKNLCIQELESYSDPILHVRTDSSSYFQEAVKTCSHYHCYLCLPDRSPRRSCVSSCLVISEPESSLCPNRSLRRTWHLKDHVMEDNTSHTGVVNRALVTVRWVVTCTTMIDGSSSGSSGSLADGC